MAKEFKITSLRLADLEKELNYLKRLLKLSNIKRSMKD